MGVFNLIRGGHDNWLTESPKEIVVWGLKGRNVFLWFFALSLFSPFSFGQVIQEEPICRLVGESYVSNWRQAMYERAVRRRSHRITVNNIDLAEDNLQFFTQELYACPEETSYVLPEVDEGKKCDMMKLKRIIPPKRVSGNKKWDLEMPLTVFTVRAGQQIVAEIFEIITCYPVEEG